MANFHTQAMQERLFGMAEEYKKTLRHTDPADAGLSEKVLCMYSNKEYKEIRDLFTKRTLQEAISDMKNHEAPKTAATTAAYEQIKKLMFAVEFQEAM